MEASPHYIPSVFHPTPIPFIHGRESMAVTNGYLTTPAIDLLLNINVDGWSIDIKGCPKMKRALVSIDHSVVYRNVRHIVDGGGHVEMVYLVVPNTNDFDECGVTCCGLGAICGYL